MQHISGTDRSQIFLFTNCLDDIISEDNPARLIDAFVAALDLESHGFSLEVPAEKGAPPYYPGLLLKIYLYGYLNRIRSSRKLEKACSINVELIWLTRQLTPSHATIANFRRDHPKALKEVFRTFNRLLRDEGLFGGKTVAIDGSKFRAQNSKKNNYNEKKIERNLAYHDRKIEKYLAALEEEDEGERAEKTWDKLHRSTAQYLRHQELAGQLKAAEAAGERQISTSDPDARALPLHRNIVEVGYNVQTATDDENCLVTHFEVTNQKDDYAQSGMAVKAKMELGLQEKDQLNVLADKGYHTGSELQKCAGAGITTFVAPRENITSKKSDTFSKNDFVYNPESDSYVCPWNEALTTNGTWYEKNSRRPGNKPYRFRRYVISHRVCSRCPFKDQCLSKSQQQYRQGRYIERSEFEDAIAENKERVEANRELYKRRQAIAEHPFGTIKRSWGYTYTLVKTIKKVEGEFTLIFTAYNLRRSMSILGAKYLTTKLKGMKNSLKGLLCGKLVRWRPRVQYSGRIINSKNNGSARSLAA